MSYRLEPAEPLAAGIRRIAGEQAAAALDSLSRVGDEPEAAIHDARKRFKKIRAVLRLVRDHVGEDGYRRENVAWRDMGRRLSAVRDAQVASETLDSLVERYGGPLADEPFPTVRAGLAERRRETVERVVEEGGAVETVCEEAEAAIERIGRWPLADADADADYWAAIAGGLRRVYRRGRKRFADASESPSVEALHEWRKRVKYLWYHLRVLRPLWPPILAPWADQAHRLADLLGDDHDLAELAATLRAEPERFADDEEVRVLLALIDRGHGELRAPCGPLGRRLYAEKPSALVRRLEGYWAARERERRAPAERG